MSGKIEAIKEFLEENTRRDLASLYKPCMEVQVNVAQDGGEKIEGDFKGRQWHGWKGPDGKIWKSFRIPWNAKSEAHYVDSELTFDLNEHAEGIGMTGWDWMNKVSRWVAFDFDAITGHSDNHQKKLDPAKLQEVADAATSIPWVCIRKSTSGKGLHMYVMLNNVPTANHMEHAALARAILGMMSGLVGFDFRSKVDNCGGNMWVWHRKMVGTDGLTLIKDGDILEEVPPNWREHLSVVAGRRSRTLPEFALETPDTFEKLAGQRAKVPLDDDHKSLIEWLKVNKAVAWWNSDYHMLVTHTNHLKEAHAALGLRGLFDTATTGSSTHNCFAFPLRGGSWAVRRFTPGVGEHSLWHQDSSGWTRIFYNQEPDLDTVATAGHGNAHKTGGYIFQHLGLAAQAVEKLGIHFEVPAWAGNRSAKVKETKDGKLSVEFTYENGDPKLDGWYVEKKSWNRVFKMKAAPPQEVDTWNFDDTIRHVVDLTGSNQGWFIKSEKGWTLEPLEHVKASLEALSVAPKDVRTVVGTNVFKCWQIVNLPFQDEYPGDREWNKNAAQLRVAPSTNEIRNYPTWSKMLNHLGKYLDEAVCQNPWCSLNGILTGADYLKCWIASMFQYPLRPLPYLFFYGDQNSGKSIFHESLSLLMTHGYAEASSALLSDKGFNGELEGAILCFVEEMDLNANKSAYNRIKSWVTAPSLSIHFKQRTPYLVANSTHWVQTANNRTDCPVLQGDTRIVFINVGDLTLEERIPKVKMMEQFKEEAADFMAEILSVELPEPNDRLNIPVIETDDKALAQEANLDSAQRFFAEKIFKAQGEKIKWGEVWDLFYESLDDRERKEWTKRRFGEKVPKHFVKGRWPSDNQFYLGNASLDPNAVVYKTPLVIVMKDRLVHNDA